MVLKDIIKMHDCHDVAITGEKGSGKDMLTGNVVIRIGRPYISNVNYGGQHIPLDFKKLDCAGNTFVNFINGNVKPYTYPYPDGANIYISDCGVILPAQYNAELNKAYPYLPTFFAISRHLGATINYNSQRLQRVWDKLREQGERYIRCRWCKVFFSKIVVQKITIYDKYQSCVDRVEPCRLKLPLLANKEQKLQFQMYKDKFYNQHGTIENHILVYINKSNYDTRFYKKLLERGGNL